MKRFVLSSLVFCFLPAFSWAFDWEDACKEGYAVAMKGSIPGEFNGCEYGKSYRLSNGLIFKCSGYSYHYSYSPDFYILKNLQHGNMKYVIDDEEFDGQLYR